jgi:di/tricarboxylate transporter
MPSDMILVFGVLAVAIILFVSDRIRLDVVALLTIITLMLTGILTPAEALAGFSDPIVLIIAGLFVVGNGLVQTGVAETVGNWLSRMAGTNEITLLTVVMLMVAALSAFMSTTGAVAILLPVTASMAWNARLNASKLLMPLAFGSLIGGMLTLIGTPPNIVVSNQLAASGYAPFGFFEFAPVGLVMLVVGIGFMVVAGRHILPDRPSTSSTVSQTTAADTVSVEELVEAYQLPGTLFLLQVEPDSPLAGQTLAEASPRARYHVNVLEIQPCSEEPGKSVQAYTAGPRSLLHINDTLHVKGRPENVLNFAREEKLSLLREPEGPHCFLSEDAGVVEVLLPPRSTLIGQTLLDTRFRDKYDVTVISILRLGKPVDTYVSTTPLRFGDTLLIKGQWDRIDLLRREHRNFVVVGQTQEMLETQHSTRRAPLAVIIMLAMLIGLTVNVLPAIVIVLLTAVAMVLTKCVSMEEAYKSINWEGVVLIAAMLPLATALQKTGGTQLITDALISTFGNNSPVMLLGILFVATTTLSLFISNTVTTVLIAPIAVQAASSLGLAPQPFLMTIAVAASAAFSTPIASPGNTLVLGPGGYRFRDYLTVGIPLQILMLFATLLVVPVLFPY